MSARIKMDRELKPCRCADCAPSYAAQLAAMAGVVITAGLFAAAFVFSIFRKENDFSKN